LPETLSSTELLDPPFDELEDFPELLDLPELEDFAELLELFPELDDLPELLDLPFFEELEDFAELLLLISSASQPFCFLQYSKYVSKNSSSLFSETIFFTISSESLALTTSPSAQAQMTNIADESNNGINFFLSINFPTF
jgi:hypothetical protein